MRVLDRPLARALSGLRAASGRSPRRRRRLRTAHAEAKPLLRLADVGGRGCRADPDRRARARPRARRRARPGLARPRRRRAGSGEVDAAADGARRDLARAAGAARDGRGVDGPGEASRRAARRRRAGRDPRRDEPRSRLRHARARAAGRLRDRLDPDALLRRGRLGAGLGQPGARSGGAAAPRRQGVRRRALPRRPRDEGRLGRRAARARAPRRLRAPVRGRPLPRAPRPARREEPLRLDERARRLRDDRRRPPGRARSLGGLRPERRRGRRGGRVRARGNEAAAARDPVARRRRPTWRCLAGSAPESIRSGSR